MKKLILGHSLGLLAAIVIAATGCAPVTPDRIQVETLGTQDYNCIKIYTVDGHEYLAQCGGYHLIHKANCKAGDGTEKPKAEK